MSVINGLILLIMLICLTEKQDIGMFAILITGCIAIVANLIGGIFCLIRGLSPIHSRFFLWFFVMLVLTPVLAAVWFFLHFTKIGG